MPIECVGDFEDRCNRTPRRCGMGHESKAETWAVYAIADTDDGINEGPMQFLTPEP